MPKVKSKNRKLVKKEKVEKQIKLDNKTLKKKKTLQKSIKPQSSNPKKPNSQTLDSDSIQLLLESYTKEQLIDFLIDSAVKTPSVYSKIVQTADVDVSHRKIFVYGLSWDTTREAVVAAFESYGELEDCHVVLDRVTGKAKGFGFVVFKSRDGAIKALKEPKKKIVNRIVSCQLASIGHVGVSDSSSRKIYVNNVQPNVDSFKLREFFEKFGEIEAGPLGFDVQTGKSRGYALFVYKNLDGVKKALEEPNKIFDGVALNCRMADSGKNSKSVSSVTTVMQPMPQLMSAVGAQNVGLLGQQSMLNPMLAHQLSYNPVYGGLYANTGAGAGAGLMNPLLAQGLIGANQFGQLGVGLGGYGSAMMGQGMGSLGANQSVLGSYSGSSSAPMLQGLQHAYPETKLGQTSTSRAAGSVANYRL